MKSQKNKTQDPNSFVTPAETKALGRVNTAQFEDYRPRVVAQRKLRKGMSNNERSRETTQLRKSMMEGSADQATPIQRKSNHTGLPDNLKSGIENLSGYAMDDVKVHYNSSKPAQLQAHAYAQGSDIHLAPGQEKHLGHEAWHVVQQKQGRVKPTKQLKSKVNINDDAVLEKEADLMGNKALANLAGEGIFGNTAIVNPQNSQTQAQLRSKEPVFQRVIRNHTITRYDGGARDQLTFDDGNRIGGGAGGSVHRGTIATLAHPNAGTNVIVKLVGNQGEYDMEKDIFQQIHNQNVAGGLIGAIGYNDIQKIIVIDVADGSLDHQLPRGIVNKIDQIKNLWDGLENLHGLGFTHGDVSQKNTLRQDETAVVADFGGSESDANVPLTAAARRQTDYQDFIKTSCNILLGNLANNPGSDMNISLGRINALRDILYTEGAEQADINEVLRVAGLYNWAGSVTTRPDVLGFLAVLDKVRKRRSVKDAAVATGIGVAAFVLTAMTLGPIGVSPTIYYAAATLAGLTMGQKTYERMEEHNNTIDHG